MPILLITPKLHHFEFQNYNTHQAQNDIVLAINFFIFYFFYDEKKGMKIGGGWGPIWGWSGQPQKAKKKTKNGYWAFGGGRTTPKGLGVTSAF
jgi:hypothetical protein